VVVGRPGLAGWNGSPGCRTAIPIKSIAAKTQTAWVLDYGGRLSSAFEVLSFSAAWAMSSWGVTAIKGLAFFHLPDRPLSKPEMAAIWTMMGAISSGGPDQEE